MPLVARVLLRLPGLRDLPAWLIAYGVGRPHVRVPVMTDDGNG